MHARLFFWFFIGNGIVFLLLFLFFPLTYDAISQEDHLIENLTALALLFSGFYLIRAAVLKQHGIRKVSLLLLLVGVVFLLGAGEEISWGQRIFGWDTPEGLAAINEQNETNFHNINKKLFDRLVDRATIVFVLIGTTLLLLHKKMIKGIPYPDAYVLLAFAITPFYHQYNELESDFYLLLFLPLIALLYYGWKYDKAAFRATLITVAYLAVMSYAHYSFNDQFAYHNNSANEYREYLFSLACLFYAFHIFKSKKGAQ